jgi:hypothetical protein
VAPVAEGGAASRRYRDHSLVLETQWDTPAGRLRVIDFMLPRGEAPHIVRIVEGVSGRVSVRSELVIRFGYGRIVPWVRRVDDAWVASAGPEALCFRTRAPTRGENLTTVSTFEVGAGERIPLTLSWFPRTQGCRRSSIQIRRCARRRISGTTGRRDARTSRRVV